MNSIVGYGPMFRDAEDFRQDARIERENEAYRRWLSSPEGRDAVAAARYKRELYKRAAIVMSRRYRETEEWLEAALRGVDAQLPNDPDFGTPEEAILRDGPAYTEERQWFSH